MAIKRVSYTFVIFPDQLDFLHEIADEKRTTMSALLRDMITEKQEEYAKSKLATRGGNASKGR